MRSALALVLAALMLLAILPAPVSALSEGCGPLSGEGPSGGDEDEGERDESSEGERGERGDELDEEERFGAQLDDDVIHTRPVACAPCGAMRWSREPEHRHPDGRSPSRASRPPRAR